MIIRKITATIAALYYTFNFIRGIILLPNNIKLLGKSEFERSEIYKSINTPFYQELNDISNILWPIGLLAMSIFMVTFIVEKNNHQNTTSNDKQIIHEPNISNPIDQPSAGINVISFLIPLVGLIIYLTERDRSPRKAISAGKAAIWGVSITILLSIISFVITFIFINSISY